LPEVVVFKQEVPQKTGVAVRAAPQVHDLFSPEKGAIAIVVDCSGSMLQSKIVDEGVPLNGQIIKDYDELRKGYDKKTPCRFHDATDALKEVLATIKKDAYVSVMIFSQQVKGGQPKASETITVLREPKRWDPAEMPDLMEELEKLVPFNDTPLVR